MPVQPGNTNFPQGGPRPVAPAVIYDQQPTNVGFFGYTLPGLVSLAQLAGGVKDLIEGDPLKDAQAKHFGALADETAARTEQNKDKGLTDAISSWGTIIGKSDAYSAQRDNAFQAGIADLKRYGLSEEEARQALQGFATRSAQEDLTARGLTASGVYAPGQQPGQAPPAATGAQGSNPAGGLGADMTAAPQQTQQAPSPDPRAAAAENVGSRPQDPTNGEAPEGGQRTYPAPGEVAGQSQSAADTTRAAAAEAPFPGASGAQNPFQNAQELAGVKPTPEPIIRTAMGPVPTPQRQFADPNRISVDQGKGPDDYIPITEAHANPTFSQASQALAAEAAPSVRQTMAEIAAIQILDAEKRGVEAPSDALLMLRMTERQAKQAFDARAEKLGIHHEKAGDLLSMVGLYRFMKTKGQGMSQEELHNVTSLYRENPALLKFHWDVVSHWTGEDAEYAKLEKDLRVAQLRFEGQRVAAAATVQSAGIRAQATVDSAQISANAVNLRTEMMWQQWGQKLQQQQIETRIGLVNSAVEELDKKDTRINELLTDLNSAAGLDPGFKARIQRASAISQGFRAVQQKVQDNNDTIRRYQEEMKTYAPYSKDAAGYESDTYAQSMVKEKERVEKAIQDLQRENEEFSAILRGEQGMGKMMDQAFRDIMQDPKYADAKNATTASGQTVYSIVDQMRNLSQGRAAAQESLDILRDDGKRRVALDQIARNWQVWPPPTFEQFAATQVAGHPLSVLIPNRNELVDVYADFREMVRYHLRERKAKDRDGYRMPEKRRDARAGRSGSTQNGGRRPGSAPAQSSAPASPYGGMFAPPDVEDDDAWGPEDE